MAIVQLATELFHDGSKHHALRRFHAAIQPRRHIPGHITVKPFAFTPAGTAQFLGSLGLPAALAYIVLHRPATHRLTGLSR